MTRLPNLALVHEAAQRIQRAPVASAVINGAPQDIPAGVEFCTAQESSGERYRVVSDGTGGFQMVPA